MALKLTVESFLQVVRQSGLIDPHQLQTLLSKYAERGLDIKKSQVIADALIADDLLTKWQAEKLLNGKHKGFVLGKYRLLGLLGTGGMSSVYLAEHLLMKRRCAIKVLPAARVNDSSYLARFHREAQAVASVDHPNIVRAYDVDCAQDKDAQIHFLVMEYVPGQSLQELVTRDGPLDYALAMDFIRQSALGLDHAHRAGMVHRDIKPGNLLIDKNGVIKILDMGLARFFDDRETSSLTVAHEEKVLGTADYLAPEQAMDSHSVDTRADLYSLGCSLYFLLTGKPPYDEGTLTQRLMWHQTKPFPPLTNSRLDCPTSLIAILDKMVQKNPADRYQTGADVAAACQLWLIENGGDDWRQKIGVALRDSSRGSSAEPPSRQPTRDLQSDSEIARQPVDEPATKISTRPPSTKISTPPPAVASPAALPVAPPVAQPVMPASPPVAKPVIPVARPIAPPPAPAIPVAKPVVAVAQPVAPIQPTVAFAEPDVVPNDDDVAEPAGDDGIFSLFGQEASSALAPDTGPLDEAAANTMTSFPTDEPETVTFVKSSSAIKRSASATKLPATKLPTGLTKKLQTINWKQPKVLAVAGIVASLLVGTGIWLNLSPSSKQPNSKNSKKKSNGTDSVVKPTKEVVHEVKLQVGSTSEYTTIGRALHAIIEDRADYETKANGKPLRFILQIAAGKPYEESLTIDESFPGELHLAANGTQRPKLTPLSDEPAISIKNRAGVTVDGMSITMNQFAANSRGVVISGNSPKCHIKNCFITNIGKAGVELIEAAGTEESDAIVIDDLTFQNPGSDSLGVLISGKEASRHVVVQRCKFVGSMGAAVAVQAPVVSLTIRQCAVSGASTAVRFAEALLLKEVTIDHCSFKLTNKSKAGLLFDALPADGSSGFSFRNNLFAGLKSPEVLIEKNYDPTKFDPLLSTEKPSENNWSDRVPPAKAANNERDIIEQRVPVIEFADSAKSSSDLYLVPKAGAEYKSAGVKAK